MGDIHQEDEKFDFHNA